MSRSVLNRLLAGALIAGAAAAVPAPAQAATDHLVINEIYVNGGSTGATYLNKFVEIYNPTSDTVDVDGWSVQYRSATGVANFSSVIALGDHEIPAGGTFLVGGSSNAANGVALPTPDVSNTGASFAGSATGGTLALVKSETALTGVPATVLADPNLVDLIGYGTSAVTFETAAKSSGYSVTASLNRTAAVDTDNNSADFTAAAPTPVACGEACDSTTEPVDPTDPTVATIAEIQGTGTASPLVGQTVTTTGVVTAVYSTGGFNGAYIQAPGTGGAINLAAHTASDGLFVFGSPFAADVAIGDTVDVTGPVVEYFGMTEMNAATWVDSTTPGTVAPATVTFPLTETQKESLEGMLLDLSGQDFTVTNNYSTNQYGEIGLATGTTPLPQPTNEVRPNTAAYDALVADNARRSVTVDDGKSTNFFTAQTAPLSWLRPDSEVRTSAAATFTHPVVLDYRNNNWKLQPTLPLSGAASEPVTFESTRTTSPEDVGGAVKLASFNVLNYFTTTAENWVAQGGGRSCTYYTDRDGARVTANTCLPSGPRGAADDVNLARQQAKIVKAINSLDADVLSLEEIEDTSYLGGAAIPEADRDHALKALVAALNTAAGSTVWAAVESPATIPSVGRDVIRSAFIYQPAVVAPVGPSTILNDAAFSNARAPLAQEFRPVGGTENEDFLAIVNHFKSKGSGSGSDADQGDGQGASNASRVRQATALVDFARAQEAAADTDQVFLLGDFNAYSKEDPLKVLTDAGFVDVGQSLTDEETYQFSGLIGSLDHVFASPRAFERVTGADVWTINAPETIAMEYSRFNYNVTNLFDASTPFRASDHDPVLVGFDPGTSTTTTTATAPATVWSDESFDVTVNVSSGDGEPTGTATVSEGDNVIGTADVTGGTATVTVPAGVLTRGEHTLDVAFDGGSAFAGSSTSVTVEVLVDSAITATAPTGTYGKSTAVTVLGAAGASGVVYVSEAGRLVGSALMMNGRATVNLAGTTLRPGSHDLAVFYGGAAGFEPSSTTMTVNIAKASAKVKGKAITAKITPKKRATVRVTVSTAGFSEKSGRVSVYRGRTFLGSAPVKNGKATVTLAKLKKKGKVTLTAKYSGSALTNPASGSFKVRVR